MRKYHRLPALGATRVRMDLRPVIKNFKKKSAVHAVNNSGATTPAKKKGLGDLEVPDKANPILPKKELTRVLVPQGTNLPKKGGLKTNRTLSPGFQGNTKAHKKKKVNRRRTRFKKGKTCLHEAR